MADIKLPPKTLTACHQPMITGINQAKTGDAGTVKKKEELPELSMPPVQTGAPTTMPAHPNAMNATKWAKGLADISCHAKDALAGQQKIENVDQANAYAQEQLKTYFADQGLDLANFDVSVRFSTWKPEDFANQSQIKHSVAAAAGFLVQLCKNVEHFENVVHLDVNLTAQGSMDFNSITNTLGVPVNKGLSETELSKAFADSVF